MIIPNRLYRQLVVASIILFLVVVAVALLSTVRITRLEVVRIVSVGAGLILLFIALLGLVVLAEDIRTNGLFVAKSKKNKC